MQKPTLDKSAMIKWLGDVIEAEIKKPDNEIDTALIVECSEYLDELLSDIQISDEQIERNIAKIKNKSSNTKNTSSIRRTPRMRRFIAAICAAALLVGGTVSAYAFIPAFRDMVREVLDLPSGSSVDSEGITFVHRGKTREYNSLEELVTSENLDILYPHNLPDELKIEFIRSMGAGDSLVYSISFIDNIASISIKAGEIDISQLSTDSEMFESTKNVISYLLAEGEVFTSVTVYNGYTYYVTTYNRSHLTIILENLY